MAEAPCFTAENETQLGSLAEQSQSRRYALYEASEGRHEVYHQISCYPITKRAEDDMEIFSDIWTWGEEFKNHWEEGLFLCSRCSNPLFASQSKWDGPCVWPSFRSVAEANVKFREVSPYNNYTCTVKEIYCDCDLFIGHAFEDGVAKGDTHPDAHWRM